MRRFSVILAILPVILSTGRAQGFPQFVKEGYFGCAACHVSQAGGDTLTPYGRTIADQKLAMTSFENEATNTWGTSESPTSLILSGHFRRLQIFTDNNLVRSASVFNMQRDVDLGFWSERVAVYLTATPFAQEQDNQEIWGVRKWIMRVTPQENTAIAVGAFRPKFGLNLNDHNAYVVSEAMQRIGHEHKITEFAVFTEMLEITIATSLKNLPDRPFDQDENRPDLKVGTASLFALSAHRIMLSLAQENSGTNSEKETKRMGGLAGTFVLTPELTTSFEFDWIDTEATTWSSLSFASHANLVWEATKGLWIQPFHETLLTDRFDPRTKQEKQGLRISLFPRPHFDIKATMGQVKDHQTYVFSNFGSLLFHFWL